MNKVLNSIGFSLNIEKHKKVVTFFVKEKKKYKRKINKHNSKDFKLNKKNIDTFCFVN